MLSFLIISLGVYAILKWWFDTSILDHGCDLLTKHSNFMDFKMSLGDSKFALSLVELFECPWCLSFHISWILNLFIFQYNIDSTYFLSVLATAGGGMFLWQLDLKD